MNYSYHLLIRFRGQRWYESCSYAVHSNLT